WLLLQKLVPLGHAFLHLFLGLLSLKLGFAVPVVRVELSARKAAAIHQLYPLVCVFKLMEGDGGHAIRMEVIDVTLAHGSTLFFALFAEVTAILQYQLWIRFKHFRVKHVLDDDHFLVFRPLAGEFVWPPIKERFHAFLLLLFVSLV